MEKEFVKYEIALELKELRFDEPCLGYYVGKDKEVYMSNETLSAPFQFRLESKTTFVAPTFSQAFRFFRDKYGLLSFIDMDVYSFYRFTIYEGKCISVAPYRAYEEAELACLVKLIEIVKEKK